MARYFICKCGSKHEQGTVCHKKYRDGSVQGDKYNEKKNFYASYKWRKVRERILSRDKHMCQRCWHKYKWITTDKLTAHHIKSREHYPELQFDDGNLVCLCMTCNLQLGTKDEIDFEFEIKEEYRFF